MREVDDADEPLLVLGGGSQPGGRRRGFAGTVVQVATRGVVVDSATTSAAGRSSPSRPGRTGTGSSRTPSSEGWSGVEALSGIPGSVGATPIQNVGAYGQEVAQTIARVRVWDRREERVRTMTSLDCGFSYRHSRFKGTDRYVVLDVMFQLSPGRCRSRCATPSWPRSSGSRWGSGCRWREVREAVLALRRRQGMVLDPADHDTWSCGSFFTNPVLSAATSRPWRRGWPSGWAPTARAAAVPGADGSVKTSAAWLIERAGFAKGYGLPGPAALSTKHTLALTNRGAATASEVPPWPARCATGCATPSA